MMTCRQCNGTGKMRFTNTEELNVNGATNFGATYGGQTCPPGNEYSGTCTGCQGNGKYNSFGATGY